MPLASASHSQALPLLPPFLKAQTSETHKMKETTKILVLTTVLIVITVVIPVGLYYNYSRVRDIVTNGRDSVLVVNGQKATLNRGYTLYEAGIDRRPVLLRTRVQLTPGNTYQIIYSPAKLADYYALGRKEAFYGYVFGSKSIGAWRIFRLEFGDFLIMGALGFECLFIACVFASVIDYRREKRKRDIELSNAYYSKGDPAGF
jgi:hypothetical protein